MSRYRRAITPEELQEQREEQERLEAEQAEKEKQEEERLKEPEKDFEEETFKKRYGDLRTHAQRKEQELNDRIKRLEKQLEESAQSQLELKDIASEDDAKAWAEKYPELAKIFRFFAVNESKETTQKFEKDIEKLNEMRANAERASAYQSLIKEHPDFEDLRKDPNFHEWVERKGGWVYDALYNNDSNAELAIDAVSLYKSQNPPAKKEEPKEEPKEAPKKNGAAESVTRKSNSRSPDGGEGKVKWSESYIEKMSKKDSKFFDKHEEEIMKAVYKNEFIYDITHPDKYD